MSVKREFGPAQLARWIGMELADFQRARRLGLVPPPDLGGDHWSEEAAGTLPQRAEAIRTGLDSAPAEAPPPDSDAAGGEAASTASAERPATAAPASEGAPAAPLERDVRARRRVFGPIQLAHWLGLQRWQIERAVQQGIVPEPDVDGRVWSRTLALTLPERTAEIRAAVGDHPGHGSVNAARLLARTTGLRVTRDDIVELHRRGLIEPVGAYRRHALYGHRELQALDPADVAEVVREREEWIGATFSTEQAAARRGWPVGLFEVAAERAGLLPGWFDRYTASGVDSLDLPAGAEVPPPRDAEDAPGGTAEDASSSIPGSAADESPPGGAAESAVRADEATAAPTAGAPADARTGVAEHRPDKPGGAPAEAPAGDAAGADGGALPVSTPGTATRSSPRAASAGRHRSGAP